MDWRSPVVVKNVESASFADALVYREGAEEESDNILCALQPKKLKDPVSAKLLTDEHNKNLKAIEEIPQGSILEKQKIRSAHTVKQGSRNFEAKSLQGDTDITITLPANPPAQYFDKIETVAPGTLCIPNSFNFPCMDMLLAPKCLLQITTDKEHGIMSEKYKELLQTLVEKGWIRSFEEVQMVFVVPQDIYDEYKKHHYLTKGKTVNKRVSQDLKDIKQYVLGSI
ncbi:hypothetical protein BGX21_002170 [Mortierella sp. AD011]|nr:hypothetical protein BGX20_003649 [Mortierella sp. AD010]KAF9381145.1 hypothetical protein BGX21_002170 [Mortierella sp. AD011]